jgi:hypothetical protein
MHYRLSLPRVLPNVFPKIQIEIFKKEISKFFGGNKFFRLLVARCK